jgi:hypothetical protein
VTEIQRLECRLFNRYYTPTGIYELRTCGFVPMGRQLDRTDFGRFIMKFNHLELVKDASEFHMLLRHEDLMIYQYGICIETWMYCRPPLQEFPRKVNWKREGF